MTDGNRHPEKNLLEQKKKSFSFKIINFIVDAKESQIRYERSPSKESFDRSFSEEHGNNNMQIFNPF